MIKKRPNSFRMDQTLNVILIKTKKCDDIIFRSSAQLDNDASKPADADMGERTRGKKLCARRRGRAMCAMRDPRIASTR